MIITARFASTCEGCGRSIHPGDKVEWTKGSKARHPGCKATAAAAAPAPELCAAHGDTTAAFVLQHLTSPIPPSEASREWDRASEADRKAAIEACHGDPWCAI